MTHAVVGYPSLEANWRMLACMREAGVALVELQMPFSEPIADGPLFVKANQAALHRGLHWDDYFGFMARAAAEFKLPLLFMGYYNSVFRMGESAFCARLQASGGRGYIIADLPPEQAVALDGHAAARSLAPIHLMTPTNSDARLKEIAENGAGFIYCVARKGVTGARTQLEQAIIDYIGRCRKATDLPLALGFGIQTPDDIRLLKGRVDIAIIGTVLLETWEQNGESGYRDFLHSLSQAV
jgi:tryptophan synthase alpha chain